MKYFLSIVLLFSVLSCRQVEPEEKAAVILYQDFSMCASCGGWIIQIDSANFRADLTKPFDVENKSVWIRFKADESNALKKAGRWLKISSIRNK